ncbi:sulfate ABC transporter sulfate-binding protein [Mycobacterium tuberculosis]|nr:sulfate ABC transporter sulfate-binding protein [Mycobacterium tuberculosis]
MVTSSPHLAAATSFKNFQYTAQAQKVWAQAGFRPVDPAVAADFRDQFPVPAKLWTIADLGGWSAVDPQLFDKNAGSITKIYTQATG